MKRIFLGFTLIEIIISISVIGLTFSSIITGLGVLLNASNDPLLRLQGYSVLRSYLDEITNNPIVDPESLKICDPTDSYTFEGSIYSEQNLRSDFDDACDYDGIVDEQPKNRAGDLLTNFSNFKVSVSVKPSPIGEIQNPSNALKIQVSIKNRNEPIGSVTTYITKH